MTISYRKCDGEHIQQMTVTYSKCDGEHIFYLFNKKKTTCVKFGDLIKNGEKAFLDGSDLVWKDNVRHLGKFVDSTCNDDFDCNAKISLFIAYFNKMMANYSSLQPTVLIN